MQHHHHLAQRYASPIPASMRGKWLFWLVFGSGLAFLLVTVFTDTENNNDRLIGAMAICIWLVLAYCSFRGQQWARWTGVVMLAVTGSAIGVVDVILAILPGRTNLQGWLLSLIPIALVVAAAILAFSESVGDFIAAQHGIPTVDNWNQVAVALRPIQRAERPDLDRLPGAYRQRRAMIKRTRSVTVAVLSLSWTAFLATVGWICFSLSSEAQDFLTAFGSVLTLPEALANSPLGGLYAPWYLLAAFFLVAIMVLLTLYLFGLALGMILVLGYLTLYVIPFLLTLPFVLGLARRWRDPVTFLILRPFNRDRITEDLSQFLRDEFAAFGHCYTLSDRQVRVPLYVRIPVLQGQLSFFNFRLRKIRQPRHIEKLADAMRKRVRRNLNWCFSRTKLFPITCCDPGWRACVARLVEEVDIVVADLSSITANIVWELEFLRDSGAFARTVFVVEASQCAAARERISQVMGPFPEPLLLPYGPGLASDSGAAAGRIMEILRGGRWPGAPQHPCEANRLGSLPITSGERRRAVI